MYPDWWTGGSTNDWHSNGYELSSATRRFVSTRLRDIFMSRFLKNKDRKLAQTINSSSQCIAYVVTEPLSIRCLSTFHLS
jgi:hypothetical protein